MHPPTDRTIPGLSTHPIHRYPCTTDSTQPLSFLLIGSLITNFEPAPNRLTHFAVHVHPANSLRLRELELSLGADTMIAQFVFPEATVLEVEPTTWMAIPTPAFPATS